MDRVHNISYTVRWYVVVYEREVVGILTSQFFILRILTKLTMIRGYIIQPRVRIFSGVNKIIDDYFQFLVIR